MTERASLFLDTQIEAATFQQNLRPIGRERGWLDVSQITVDLHYGRETDDQDGLRVTVFYHGHPGYSARFVDHGQDLELVEMREVFGGRRGKSLHVGMKNPELVRDIVMPALLHPHAPWKRLTMGPVIDIAGVADMGPGEQQRMITNLPQIFGMEPMGRGFAIILR